MRLDGQRASTQIDDRRGQGLPSGAPVFPNGRVDTGQGAVEAGPLAKAWNSAKKVVGGALKADLKLVTDLFEGKPEDKLKGTGLEMPEDLLEVSEEESERAGPIPDFAKSFGG